MHRRELRRLRAAIRSSQLESAERKMQAYATLEGMFGRQGIYRATGLRPERLQAVLGDRLEEWRRRRA